MRYRTAHWLIYKCPINHWFAWTSRWYHYHCLTAKQCRNHGRVR